MKKPEQLRARAESLRQQADALEQEALQLEDLSAQKCWDALRESAQRALNGWDTARMRQAAETVRDLYRTLSVTLHDARIRALCNLRTELLAKADKVEKARLVKRLYVENPGSSAAEIEVLLAARWEEHRRNV